MSVDSKELRGLILTHLRQPGYQPLDKVELSKALDLSPSARREVRTALADLEKQGAIVRLPKERYALPEAASLLTGKLEVHRNGSAHVLGGGNGQPDVFIPIQRMGTAMHGDQVLVEIGHGRGRGPDARVEGRVVRVVTRASTVIVGILQQSPRKLLYVAPEDSRFPHSVYVTPGGRPLPRPPQVGDKVVVELAPWENPDTAPEGEIIEVLGRASDPGVDMLAIVRKYDLRPEFPPKVVREAESIPERLREEDYAGREDLREQPAITIDPMTRAISTTPSPWSG